MWSTLRKQNLKENKGHLKKTANNTEKDFQLFEESKCNEKYEVQNAVMVPVLLYLVYSCYETKCCDLWLVSYWYSSSGTYVCEQLKSAKLIE